MLAAQSVIREGGPVIAFTGADQASCAIIGIAGDDSHGIGLCGQVFALKRGVGVVEVVVIRIMVAFSGRSYLGVMIGDGRDAIDSGMFGQGAIAVVLIGLFGAIGVGNLDRLSTDGVGGVGDLAQNILPADLLAEGVITKFLYAVFTVYSRVGNAGELIEIIIAVFGFVAEGVDGSDWTTAEVIAMNGLVGTVGMSFGLFDQAVGKVVGVIGDQAGGEVMDLGAVAIGVIAILGGLSESIGLF